MRNKLLVVLFLAVAVFVVLNLLSSRNSSEGGIWLPGSSQGQVVSAQVVDSNGAPVTVVSSNNGGGGGAIRAASGGGGRFPAVWQRDKAQYSTEAEWRTWAASACSAAALTSVLNGYGNSLKVTNVLEYLQQQNAIKAGAGLFRYDVFNSIANKY